MGTKFAPVYATLVIGYLEEMLYEKINAKYGNQLTNEFIKNWKRFLVIALSHERELLELENMLNSLHSDIKITDKQLPF